MEQMTPESHQEPPSILIVDDTPCILQLLTSMMKEHGYRVRSAPSGKLAIQEVGSEKPDLILLDVNMPEMSGFEVCEVLQANQAWKEIPVLFISGMTETTEKVKAFAVGGVDYVTKPFQCEEVHARVETHLRIRSLQRLLSEQNENLERLVAERTRELAKAYDRLQILGRLKDDFLRMISHEIRTPANGILGVGNLVLDLCPTSECRTLYADLFEQSSSRLNNLIEDATLIADMESVTVNGQTALPFRELLAEVRAALPDIQISIEPSSDLEAVLLKGQHPLLKRAMESMILLATSFSRNKHAVHVKGAAGESSLRVHIEVDALSLSGEQAAAFFEIESGVRSASSAEGLGLAPVVAHQIISAFGGEMRLVKGEGAAGYVEVVLIREQGRACATEGSIIESVSS